MYSGSCRQKVAGIFSNEAERRGVKKQSVKPSVERQAGRRERDRNLERAVDHYRGGALSTDNVASLRS